MQKFPKDFIFSTSTCAFQIEGGRELGGRTLSIWDSFTRDNFYIPKAGEAAREINSIEVASDFYHRYKSDAKIMKHLGVNGFVYNMDWARIMPDSSGIPNEEGLLFYENVFKELNANGVKPVPILYHWDTPLWLEEMGGTMARVFADKFQEFAKVVFERLGKYTDIWFVNDENSTYTTSAYLDNYSPPQKKDPKSFWKAVHYLNLSAALCKVEFNKAKKKGFINKDAKLGIDHDWCPAIPYDKNDQDDINACTIFNEYNLDLWLDPNMKGTYPDCFWKETKTLGLEDLVQDGDMELMKANTLELIGWNYYRPAIIASPKRMDENISWFNEPDNFITKEAYIVYPKTERYTDWKWLIKPENLVNGAKILFAKYKKPLMIIENGIGHFDKKINGIVEDKYRMDYLNEHIRMVQKAMDEGIPFIGYSLWTFNDIFSPSGGYRKKYGLVGVDFEGGTLDRYPKASFFWYKNVIKNLSAELKEIDYKTHILKAQEDKDNKVWK